MTDEAETPTPFGHRGLFQPTPEMLAEKARRARDRLKKAFVAGGLSEEDAAFMAERTAEA